MARLLLFLALLCMAGEARAEWHRVETPDFVIRADLPEPELRELGRQIEMLDALLRAMTGVTTPADRRKTEILIIPDLETGVRITGLPDFPGGVTWPGSMGAMIIASYRFPEDYYGYNVREVLFHEYTHGFMAHFMGTNQPGWFIEGFACLFQTAKLTDDGKVEFGTFPVMLEGELDPKHPVSFRSIMSISGVSTDTASPLSIYTQGWVLAHHYYFGGPRAGEIGAYLSAVRKRQPVNPETLFKGGVAAFDADMATWFAALPPPKQLTLPKLDSSRVAVRPMRPGEVALIERQMIDMALVQPGDDPKLAEQKFNDSYQAARALYVQYPEPELGFYVAQFAYAAFDLAGADTLLDRLLATDSKNPDLLAFRGLVLVDIARETPEKFDALILRSRALIQRAMTLDPANPVAAVAMFRNLSADQGATPAARTALMRAVELNPDDMTLLQTALEFALRNN
ncbi:MAG: tetratricopeptide repeat protein, partial [Sphingomonas sp.]